MAFGKGVLRGLPGSEAQQHILRFQPRAHRRNPIGEAEAVLVARNQQEHASELLGVLRESLPEPAVRVLLARGAQGNRQQVRSGLIQVEEPAAQLREVQRVFVWDGATALHDHDGPPQVLLHAIQRRSARHEESYEAASERRLFSSTGLPAGSLLTGVT